METCRTCHWFVNDDVDSIGEFEHETALKYGCGFCLIEELFTNVKPDSKACRDYQKDEGEKKE